MKMNSYKYYQHDGRNTLKNKAKEDKTNGDVYLLFIT